MKLWWCLFKKEFRLMQSFLLLNGLSLFIFATIKVYMASYSHSGVPSLVLFIVMVGHYFYLLIYMLYSFRSERNYTPIWLQTPQSGWFMLSAKFAAGILKLCISLTLITLLWLWVMQLDFQNDLHEGIHRFSFLHAMEDLIMQRWGLLALVFVPRALLLAALGVFIYYVSDAFKYYLRGWRWVLFPILYIIAIQLIVQFTDTSLYEAIFHWGDFALPELSTLVSAGPSGGSKLPSIPLNLLWGRLTLGDVIYRLIITSIVFYMAGWLLDRKVEV